jgi:hypothetical protein
VGQCPKGRAVGREEELAAYQQVAERGSPPDTNIADYYNSD